MNDVSALLLKKLQEENARLLALIGQKEQTIQQQKSSIETLQHQLHELMSNLVYGFIRRRSSRLPI